MEFCKRITGTPVTAKFYLCRQENCRRANLAENWATAKDRLLLQLLRPTATTHTSNSTIAINLPRHIGCTSSHNDHTLPRATVTATAHRHLATAVCTHTPLPLQQWIHLVHGAANSYTAAALATPPATPATDGWRWLHHCDTRLCRIEPHQQLRAANDNACD